MSTTRYAAPSCFKPSCADCSRLSRLCLERLGRQGPRPREGERWRGGRPRAVPREQGTRRTRDCRFCGKAQERDRLGRDAHFACLGMSRVRFSTLDTLLKSLTDLWSEYIHRLFVSSVLNKCHCSAAGHPRRKSLHFLCGARRSHILSAVEDRRGPQPVFQDHLPAAHDPARRRQSE